VSNVGVLRTLAMLWSISKLSRNLVQLHCLPDRTRCLVILRPPRYKPSVFKVGPSKIPVMRATFGAAALPTSCPQLVGGPGEVGYVENSTQRSTDVKAVALPIKHYSAAEIVRLTDR